jgi:hypothetical protein
MWIASDSTYLVVSFATDDGGSAYVQFLSDPLHRVLWEVSSAATTSRVSPKLEMVGERIATERLVHERLRPGELAVMLRSWGYVVEVVEPAGEPPSILASGPTGKRFVVVPEGSPDEYDRYEQYTLRMRLPRDGPRGDALRAGAVRVRFVRAYAEAVSL